MQSDPKLRAFAGREALRHTNLLIPVFTGVLMKIYEFCMFHNEHAALEIKRRESSSWVDELHLCESDRTFRGGIRQPVLPASDEFLKTHLYPGAKRFEPGYRWGFSRYPPFFRKKKRARQNETRQRDYVHEALCSVSDDDIIILSDIDEVVDQRRAEELVDRAKRSGVASIRMHHTLFFVNLYSTNWHEVWPGSPPDYAYRVFAMTGAHFHAMKTSSDRLRRLGEWGKLNGEIDLLDGFAGFHHSWLGDEQAAMDKLQSYSHSLSEHDSSLSTEDGSPNAQRLREAIQSGQSIFPGNELEIRSFDELPPLKSVSELIAEKPELLL